MNVPLDTQRIIDNLRIAEAVAARLSDLSFRRLYESIENNGWLLKEDGAETDISLSVKAKTGLVIAWLENPASRARATVLDIGQPLLAVARRDQTPT